MVIMFLSDKARNQLLNKGIVYTLRHIRHKEGLDWCTNMRGGKKICNVRITYCDNGKYTELREIASLYVSDSGFDSIEEWINQYKRYRSSKYPTFWLYRVEKVI
jgi:hypothetical protein